jgi:hypothetical protein
MIVFFIYLFIVYIKQQNLPAPFFLLFFKKKLRTFSNNLYVLKGNFLLSLKMFKIYF